MQIRCQFCHRPYALGKDAVHAALDLLAAQQLNHYDANCPHCGKTNHISKNQLKRSAPDWQAKPNPPEE